MQFDNVDVLQVCDFATEIPATPAHLYINKFLRSRVKGLEKESQSFRVAYVWEEIQILSLCLRFPFPIGQSRVCLRRGRSSGVVLYRTTKGGVWPNVGRLWRSWAKRGVRRGPAAPEGWKSWWRPYEVGRSRAGLMEITGNITTYRTR